MRGSGKTKTVVQTVVAAPTQTTTTSTTPTATQTTSTSQAPSGGSATPLSGTYTLKQTYDTSDGNLSDNPHDGIRHADMTWMALSSMCAAGTCTVQFRRVLSDSTLEGLTLSSNSPTGVFTGPIPDARLAGVLLGWGTNMLEGSLAPSTCHFPNSKRKHPCVSWRTQNFELAPSL
ncbi:MAG: hypothetical protein M3Y17_06645 [Actinomycetota bacterium]|nr:hypothetical protein [Actinomycetota bacterium]